MFALYPLQKLHKRRLAPRARCRTRREQAASARSIPQKLAPMLLSPSPALPSFLSFTYPLGFSVGSCGGLVGAPQLVPFGLFARTLVDVGPLRSAFHSASLHELLRHETAYATPQGALMLVSARSIPQKPCSHASVSSEWPPARPCHPSSPSRVRWVSLSAPMASW